MKKSVLLAWLAASISSAAFAAPRAYCGRIQCADALDGCQVNDGNTNPIVLIETEANVKFHYVSDALAQQIQGLDCGCVVGTVALSANGKPTFGPTIVYFTSAVSAYSVAESKCTAEGL